MNHLSHHDIIARQALALYRYNFSDIDINSEIGQAWLALCMRRARSILN